MKCVHCGNEIPDGSTICTFCGKATIIQENPVYPDFQTTLDTNPIKERVLAMFKDQLFLVLCILVTVATALTTFSGNLPLLQILFTIFLWIIFAKAQKNNVSIENMRSVSGTIYAGYIISYIAAGIFALLSLLSLAAMFTLNSLDYFEEIIDEISSAINFDINGYDILPELTGDTITIICFIVFISLLTAAIIMAIINFFSMRNIHKFAKSLYISAANGVYGIQKANTAMNWFLAFGIIQGISALGNLSDLPLFASTSATAATFIIAYILVKKYFKPQPIYNMP